METKHKFTPDQQTAILEAVNDHLDYNDSFSIPALELSDMLDSYIIALNNEDDKSSELINRSYINKVLLLKTEINRLLISLEKAFRDII